MSLYNTARKLTDTSSLTSTENVASASSPKAPSKNAKDASTMSNHRNVEKIVRTDKKNPKLREVITGKDDAETIQKAYKMLNVLIGMGANPRAEVYYRGTVLRIGFPK